ncbi:hypothetical protein D3C71_1841180 [compost metagenome]
MFECVADFIRRPCNAVHEFAFFGKAAPQAAIIATMMRANSLFDVGFAILIAFEERTLFLLN